MPYLVFAGKKTLQLAIEIEKSVFELPQQTHFPKSKAMDASAQCTMHNAHAQPTINRFLHLSKRKSNFQYAQI